MIDDEVLEALESVPRGERSRAVNEALTQWLLRRRREQAALKMQVLRNSTKTATTGEIVHWIRKDRERRS